MKRHCRSTPARRGTTLIEVLLGLVILSTLLVSVAMARGRFLRQWADAERRTRQTRAIDALMSRWLAGPPEAVPRGGRGVEGDVAWQTRVVPSPTAAAVGCVVVRLDTFDPAAAGPAAGPEAVSIDFLARDPRATAPLPAAPQ